MAQAAKLDRLREAITENLRVQKGVDTIEYINIGHALNDACAKQNHAIFARRGCGKTLLLHFSSKRLGNENKSVYLNCENFKQHSFPNVLIEILSQLFREIDRNIPGWFGRKKRSKRIIQKIITDLEALERQADESAETVKLVRTAENGRTAQGSLDLALSALAVKAAVSRKQEAKEKSETERSFTEHKRKLQELDLWLPRLKEQVELFFHLSGRVKAIFLQIDDFYHLKRDDQPFIVDYIHRLCKDVPLFFKIATLRHVSTLYLDRDGQPIGAQERHDYQPINKDYTLGEFQKTSQQNWQILEEFGKKAGVTSSELEALFKGAGFERLIMAGGGVPRDVLSLFLEVLSEAQVNSGSKIGKDDVRILSRTNFEKRIEELKQDSHGDEQDVLLRGIFLLRQFCLEKKTNIFLAKEQMLQQNDGVRSLFYRLLDYRIMHQAGSALTHKREPGTYQAFAIDIGCYAHFRKLQDRFAEIDLSDGDAKDKMRSAPILTEVTLQSLWDAIPRDVEKALLSDAVPQNELAKH